MKRSMIFWFILVLLVVILFVIVMGRTTITFSPFSIHMERPWNFAAWMFLLCSGVCWTLDSEQKAEQKRKEYIIDLMEYVDKKMKDNKVSDAQVKLNNNKQELENGN